MMQVTYSNLDNITIKFNSEYESFPGKSALLFQRLSPQSFVQIFTLISLNYNEWNVKLYSLDSVRHNNASDSRWHKQQSQKTSQ